MYVVKPIAMKCKPIRNTHAFIMRDYFRVIVCIRAELFVCTIFLSTNAISISCRLQVFCFADK